jgi:hypothetical protein
VNVAHAVRACFPAATREALSTAGPRPVDGILARGSAAEAASDVERLGFTVDVRLRDAFVLERATGVAVPFPFLDPALVARVRGLDRRVRFGRPGSGGCLRAWAEARGALPESDEPRGFALPLESWLRGPLASWLDAALAQDRLAAQGVWKPQAVREALRRHQAGDPGWDAGRILHLAFLAEWIARRVGYAPADMRASLPARS